MNMNRLIQSRFEALLLIFGLSAVIAATLAMYFNGPWAIELARHNEIAWITKPVRDIARQGGFMPTFLLFWASAAIALAVGVITSHRSLHVAASTR